MINDLIVLFNNVLNSAYGALKVNVATPLFYTLIIIDLMVFGMMIAINADTSPQEILKKCLTIAGLIFLFRNFSTIANTVYSSFAALGTQIPTGTTYDIKWKFTSLTVGIDHNVGPYIAQPGKILEEMNRQLMQPLWDFMVYGLTASDGPMGMKLPDFKIVITYGLALLTVIISFVLIVCQMIVIRIEFGLILCAGIVVFPFTGFQLTRFIGAKVWPALISVSMKIGIVSILTALLIKILSLLAIPTAVIEGSSFAFVVQIIVICILFMFMFIQVPHIANSILNGITGMSAGGFMQNTAAAWMAVKAGMNQISQISSKASQGGQNVGNYLAGGTASGGKETSRGTSSGEKSHSTGDLPSKEEAKGRGMYEEPLQKPPPSSTNDTKRGSSSSGGKEKTTGDMPTKEEAKGRGIYQEPVQKPPQS